MVKKFGSHITTVLYPNPCYKELCYKETALYLFTLLILNVSCPFKVFSGKSWIISSCLLVCRLSNFKLYVNQLANVIL